MVSSPLPHSVLWRRNLNSGFSRLLKNSSNLGCNKYSGVTFLRIRPGGSAPTNLRSESGYDHFGNGKLCWRTTCLMLIDCPATGRASRTLLLVITILPSSRNGLLQGDKYGNKPLATLERSQRFPDHRSKRPRRIIHSHGVPWRRRGRQQIAYPDCSKARIGLAVHLAKQRNRVGGGGGGV